MDKNLTKKVHELQQITNLSAVVRRFDRAIVELWEEARQQDQGTAWVNKHPVCRVFAKRIAELTGKEG
jgi:cob(I)alamin adenosyltransferase